MSFLNNIYIKNFSDELTYQIRKITYQIYNQPDEDFNQKQTKLKNELNEIYKKNYSTEILRKRLDYIDNVENLREGYIPSIIAGVISSFIIYVITDNTVGNVFKSYLDFSIDSVCNRITNWETKIIGALLFLLCLLIMLAILALPIILYGAFLFSNNILIKGNDLLLTYDYERELLIESMSRSKKNNPKTTNKTSVSAPNEDSKFNKPQLKIIAGMLSISITSIILKCNKVIELLNSFFTDWHWSMLILGTVIFYILFNWIFKKSKLHNYLI